MFRLKGVTFYADPFLPTPQMQTTSLKQFQDILNNTDK